MTDQSNIGLRHGPLSNHVAHLCVDMQNVFADETEWQTPWMKRVLPVVTEIVQRHPEATIFTRFMTPRDPSEASGAWRRYFERWHEFTQNEAEPRLLDLVPALTEFVPPATIIDKPAYSAFHDSPLLSVLRERSIDTLVVTGAETDVCVLATVFSAIDHGFRVVLVKDAVCSSADETHDALITVYASRFSHQVELVDSPMILDEWK
ncbi:cysteine hydrolase family protein [Consotaella salsifontis]|uniref:Nicotinamidase-related amidase n=1 Tax=Consotaella salsifontis TaxID=1365950 RepID=A0A1T4PBL6_9HYPH|nr:isochorismatase family cysteine hydrolase [Consotaella salsifontis]SJZ88218.1 Nicotinamidase-related amidase [Consotaella salsifontis]